VSIRSFLRVSLGVAAVYGIVLGSAEVWAHFGLRHLPCPGGGPVILVDTTARVLCLCRAGEPEGEFRVSLGSRGVGKRVEGDRKTPLGPYALGTPRASSSFAWFIPVAYPTPEQARQGYTGGAIGVHGPHFALAWLRYATVWFNWTAGCIAVGSRSDAEAIAAWTTTSRAAEIRIVG
jgi:hypothetical protein